MLRAMHYFTISEYARRAGITRQAVQSRIRSGSLSLTTEKRPVKVIAVEDTEVEKIKSKKLALGKDQA